MNRSSLWSVHRIALVLLASALLYSCVSRDALRREVELTRERIVGLALAQVGKPYRYGGATPAGFDCSGLVHYAYGGAGRVVSRSTESLYEASQKVDLDDARRGDLLFFDFDRKADHVAIYLGEGRFVHAPSSGRRVGVASLDEQAYRQRLRRAARLLE